MNEKSDPTRPPFEHLDEDRMIDMVNGIASKGDLDAAVRHLRECATCENLFQTMLREHEAARSQTARVLNKLGGSRVTRRPPRRLQLQRASAVVAAVLVVAAAAWILHGQHGRHDTVNGYWFPVDPSAIVLRDSRDDAMRDLSRRLEPYRRHDANEAVARLQAAPPSDDETVSSLERFYLASALVNAGRPADALPVLDALHIETLPAGWRQQARWIQYLALRDTGRTTEADAALDQLVNDPGEMGAVARKEKKERGMD